MADANHWQERLVERYGATAVFIDLIRAIRDGQYATERVAEARRYAVTRPKYSHPCRIFDVECQDQNGDVEIVRVMTDITITNVLTILPNEWPWEQANRENRERQTRARHKRQANKILDED